MIHTTTILIVDDEPLGRETLIALLHAEGYLLACASNGADALTQARALVPDLILLDVMLPELDGFAVCRQMRADPALAEVPIILVTALGDRASRLDGLAAGADEFVSKPFDRIELRARIRTITRLNRYRHLQTERAKFAHVIEVAPDGMLVADADGRIALANPAAAQLLGAVASGDLIGQPMTSFITPEQRDACLLSLNAMIANPDAVGRFETMLLSSAGQRRPVEMHVSFLLWDDRPAVLLIARDITDRKRAELLEEERHHIAYELHDGLAQFVTSTHQHFQAYAAHRRPRSAHARQELEHVLDLARRSVQEVRRVIAGLRPIALDDFGLALALQMVITALQTEGWEARYCETLGTERFSIAIETVIYRIAMEALTNVRKHAETKQVALTLERLEHSLRLTVQDWGCGFDPTTLRASTSLGQQIGLRGMRERVAFLGGHWQLQSSPLGGTTIIAEIPLL